MELARIKYTLSHRKAFRKIEKRLLGYNTIRSLFYDFDKVILYMFLPYKMAHNIHITFARHHEKSARTKSDYIQMVIDWKCARFTKSDKPLNARQTLYKFYPHLEDKIKPILEEFSL